MNWVTRPSSRKLIFVRRKLFGGGSLCRGPSKELGCTFLWFMNEFFIFTFCLQEVGEAGTLSNVIHVCMFVWCLRKNHSPPSYLSDSFANKALAVTGGGGGVHLEATQKLTWYVSPKTNMHPCSFSNVLLWAKAFVCEVVCGGTPRGDERRLSWRRPDDVRSALEKRVIAR